MLAPLLGADGSALAGRDPPAKKAECRLEGVDAPLPSVLLAGEDALDTLAEPSADAVAMSPSIRVSQLRMAVQRLCSGSISVYCGGSAPPQCASFAGFADLRASISAARTRICCKNTD